MISQDCLMQHIHLILSEIETIATLQLQTTLMQANENDLPKLFEKTRAQISGILVHFNQHTMDENNRLELHVRRKSDEPIGLWITNEMMQEFMFAVNHTDTEEGDNVYHFLESSTVKTIHHLEG